MPVILKLMCKLVRAIIDKLENPQEFRYLLKYVPSSYQLKELLANPKDIRCGSSIAGFLFQLASHLGQLAIVSGRYGQATSVLLHLIGNVMGLASLLRESWMFTGAVARMRTLYGVQASERQAAVPPNSGRTYRYLKGKHMNGPFEPISTYHVRIENVYNSGT